ncbi:MAG: homoserine dehydrogenase, partial [Olpidium bornovanus]
MTGSTATLNIALVGVGLVGSELLRQLDGLSRNGAGCPFRLVAVASSSSLVTGFSLPFAGPFALKKDDPGRVPLNFDALVGHLAALDGPSIIVDCTASDRVPELYPGWLRAGVSVVAANKKGFAGPARLFRNIYDASSQGGGGGKRACVYHESSVGAGLPVISTVRDLIKTGDIIKKIEGVFSGTLSYLFNVFSPAFPSPGAAPPKFSQVVRAAKEMGFTEPDPRDDLNGMDVARKVTILARLAGLSDAETSSLDVASLVPKPLENAGTAEEFM